MKCIIFSNKDQKEKSTQIFRGHKLQAVIFRVDFDDILCPLRIIRNSNNTL